MIDFESLGYKDITKNKPIHFIECLGESFETIYPYSKRFYKQEENIAIELKVGNNEFNLCFISGICYYSKGWQKFEVHAHKNYVIEMFTQTINAVKLKIKESIIKCYGKTNN